MGQPARGRREPATYADVEALPDHVIGEILAGELGVYGPEESPVLAEPFPELELDPALVWGEEEPAADEDAPES